MFIVGGISGFLNVVAGGGSALTLPLLIFLGLDSTTANGTNRIAIVFQSVFAIFSFKREKFSNIKLSFLMGLCAVPGGIAGALMAVQISDKVFHIILGIVNLAIVLIMLLPLGKSFQHKSLENLNWKLLLSLFIIGFYGGFIQVGVGFMMMAALQQFLRIDLARVNMHKVFIALMFTLPALMVFIYSGNVNFVIGLILSVGNSIGAWWAAKLSVKKGEKFIKYFLAFAIVIISLKLFGIY
jgi:hypothetical protein